MTEIRPNAVESNPSGPDHGPKRWRWVLVIIAVIVGGALAVRMALQDRRPRAEPQADSSSREDAALPDAQELAAPFAVGQHGSFVTSQACRKCHEEEYESWHSSFHRTMTQFATPEAVVAPLDGANVEARGRSYQFQRRGDKFYVTMAAPEWEMEQQQAGVDLNLAANVPLTTREIVIMTGSHHMQTYWIRSADGFRQVPLYWHISAQRWIPAEDSFLQPPSNDRSFTRWNDVCIKCHTSGEIPGLHPTTGFDSKVAELGIACEACHGHGQRHVAYHEGRDSTDPRDAAAKEREPDETICNPQAQSHVLASQICAQCHSSARIRDLQGWLTAGPKFQPGDDLNHHFHLVRFDKPLPSDVNYLRNDYWADGTCRTAGDEYQGLMESACHLRGELSCLSCHSLHQYADRDDQLKRGMERNAACFQCHTDYEQKLEAHTHHAAGSAGSLCYNCHMPHIMYGLLKGIRSHRIDSPSAAVTAKTGRPNACNLCHLDRTLEWSAKHLSDWYGQMPVELAGDDRQIAASVRWLLAGDATQRVIAAWHMGWPEAQSAAGNDWQGAILAHTLDDPYSVIRFVGHRSLKTLPEFENFEFDFVGPPAKRKGAVQDALTLWRKANNSLPPRAEILLDGDGKLLDAEVQRLRASRDNRPITIHE